MNLKLVQLFAETNLACSELEGERKKTWKEIMDSLNKCIEGGKKHEGQQERQELGVKQ